MTITLEEFFELRATIPIADVRSEGEFSSGHIPGSISIPVLNNEERKAVGTDYKKKGKEIAIETGHSLVASRLPAMLEQAKLSAVNNELLVYCWRGGLRSEKFCDFAANAGIKTYRLKGGYKAYRQQALQTFAKPFPLIVVGGKTGSGKTEILEQLKAHGEQVIDLEFLANHKGSAFGGLMRGKQPSTEQFQNHLYETLMLTDSNRRLWIEDESMSIGRVFIPESFWQQKASAPVIQIEMKTSDRIERLVREYSPADRSEFLQSMEKITERLGGQNFNAAKELLMKGDWHGTIKILLNYYDKTYLYALDKKKTQILGTVTWGPDQLNQLSVVSRMVELAQSIHQA